MNNCGRAVHDSRGLAWKWLEMIIGKTQLRATRAQLVLPALDANAGRFSRMTLSSWSGHWKYSLYIIVRVAALLSSAPA